MRRFLRRVDFVPYGETVDDDQERMAYYQGIQRFAAERVCAAIAATWPDPDAAPDHIRKARFPVFPGCRSWLHRMVSRDACGARMCCQRSSVLDIKRARPPSLTADAGCWARSVMLLGCGRILCVLRMNSSTVMRRGRWEWAHMDWLAHA